MKHVYCLIIFIVTGPIFAATWTNGHQVVQNLMWKPNLRGFYVSAATYDDPQSCGGTSGLYLADPALGDQVINQLYAMLLEAGTKGKTVYVWVDGCIGTIPKFNGLQVNF